MMESQEHPNAVNVFPTHLVHPAKTLLKLSFFNVCAFSATRLAGQFFYVARIPRSHVDAFYIY